MAQHTYGHDALGRRVSEQLLKGGLQVRSQTRQYNRQGWLTGVVGGASRWMPLNLLRRWARLRWESTTTPWFRWWLG